MMLSSRQAMIRSADERWNNNEPMTCRFGHSRSLYVSTSSVTHTYICRWVLRAGL